MFILQMFVLDYVNSILRDCASKILDTVYSLSLNLVDYTQAVHFVSAF